MIDDPKPIASASDLWERRIQFAKKLAIWAIFLGILYLLRSVFPLIFLTFVLSFGGNTVVAYLSRRLGWPRRLVTVLVGLAFVGLLVFVLYFVGSTFYQQAYMFAKDLPKWSKSVEDWCIQFQKERPGLARIVFGPARTAQSQPASGTQAEADPADAEQIRELLAQAAKDLAGFVLQAALSLTGLLGALGLAIIFSFLVVLDLPHVTRDTHKLRDSRLGFLYTETAETVVAFSAMVGRTFQAQAVIACVNTLLTCVGLLMLGIPNLAFLLVVVFLFSFIPIVGVFISSTPIVLVALNMPGGGLVMALACVVMITIVHCIEAYVLNPRIMGAHLHLNPVFVLLILIIGGHLVGVWGVLLGVPVAAYVYQTVRPQPSPALAPTEQAGHTGQLRDDGSL